MSKVKRSGWFKYFLGKTGMRLNGWDFEGQLPKEGKFILLCSPHTSNWDFIYLLAIMFMLRIKVSWFGKHTLFKWPLGIIMKGLGGIPVNRAIKNNFVNEVVEEFNNRQFFILALAPSGSRKKSPGWKSGFYYIAKKAKVPIICAYLDFRRKSCGIGPVIMPSDDMADDMQAIRNFYSGITARYPEKVSDISISPHEPT